MLRATLYTLLALHTCVDCDACKCEIFQPDPAWIVRGLDVRIADPIGRLVLAQPRENLVQSRHGHVRAVTEVIDVCKFSCDI
jgi:hypothetical protein